MNKQILGVFLASILVACGGTTGPEFEVPTDVPPQEEVLEDENVSQFVCSKYEYLITYYADCTRTTIVGYEDVHCQGTRYLEGIKSRYYDAEILNYCPLGCNTNMASTSCY